MDFAIKNISIKKASILGLNVEDLVLLTCCLDYFNKKDIEKIYLEEINDMIYHVDYNILINDLPIIFNGKTEKGNKEKLRRMLSGKLSNFLIRKQYSNKDLGGSKIFMYLNRSEYQKLTAL